MQHRWLIYAPLRRLTSYSTRRSISDQKIFEPGDHIILRTTNNKRSLLKGPLVPGKRVETNAGYIKHDNIIGRRDRDVISSGTNDGKELRTWRIHEVTLDEYVVNTRRLVTPIYPQDANLIVSLFDFHPQPRREAPRATLNSGGGSFFHNAINVFNTFFGRGRRSAQHLQQTVEKSTEAKPSIEILEAGTGHGTLTLFLSRAIHAANTLPPNEQSSDHDDAHLDAYESWKQSRNAVIHTIDISATFSKHAQGIVAGFRQGQYKHNVDFNVGHVQDWTTTALAQRNHEPFLTHAFLDLPSTEAQLAIVSKALKASGTLIVFNPSISQVMDSLRLVREERLPLVLDSVRELGTNGGSGGREWDVRAVIPRAFAKKKLDVNGISDTAVESGQGSISEHAADADEITSEAEDEPSANGSKWRMICRPKVGERIAGGGFIAVFKKKGTNE